MLLKLLMWDIGLTLSVGHWRAQTTAVWGSVQTPFSSAVDDAAGRFRPAHACSLEHTAVHKLKTFNPTHSRC